jgi:hypothetical protein
LKPGFLGDISEEMHRFFVLGVAGLALVGNSGACARSEELDDSVFGAAGSQTVSAGTGLAGSVGAGGLAGSTGSAGAGTGGSPATTTTTAGTTTTTGTTTSTTTAGGGGSGGSPAGTGGGGRTGASGSGGMGGGSGGTGATGGGGQGGNGGTGTGGSGGAGGPCEPAYSQGNCLAFAQGQHVSSGGHNYTCANANCRNCATVSSCEPGGTGCPWGNVWTDDGPCH